MGFNIAGKVVLVTGANRGIGRALVEEAVARGARKVYATARSTASPLISSRSFGSSHRSAGCAPKS